MEQTLNFASGSRTLKGRTIVWFSCGAASACVAKLATEAKSERERERESS